MRGLPFRKQLPANRRLRRLGADESGNVIIYVSIAAAAILGMVGLALDGSRAMITHSEAQAAADAAALAGASQLDGQSGACANAKTEAARVANQQRFASGGPANVTIASGSPVCLTSLPASDSTAIASSLVTTSDSAARFIQVTTQQLTHQTTLLNAVSSQSTATIQRAAVAGFKRSLCAASPVMMMCDTISWQPGVVFDAWSAYANGDKGFVCPGCNSAGDVQNVLASTTPAFCVDDAADPAPGNKTTKAADGINTRFGIGSTASQPADLDVVSYPHDNKTGSGWDCATYWAANHATDGLAKPAGCTGSATVTRYSVYQAERAAGKMPATNPLAAGTPTTTAERRLIYMAVMDCSGGNRPESYLKVFMIEPATGKNTKSQFVEPIGLVTSKTDPNVLHEEVQLYR